MRLITGGSYIHFRYAQYYSSSSIGFPLDIKCQNLTLSLLKHGYYLGNMGVTIILSTYMPCLFRSLVKYSIHDVYSYLKYTGFDERRSGYVYSYRAASSPSVRYVIFFCCFLSCLVFELRPIGWLDHGMLRRPIFSKH